MCKLTGPVMVQTRLLAQRRYEPSGRRLDNPTPLGRVRNSVRSYEAGDSSRVATCPGRTSTPI